MRTLCGGWRTGEWMVMSLQSWGGDRGGGIRAEKDSCGKRLRFVECITVLDSIRPRQVLMDSNIPTGIFFSLIPPPGRL